MSVIGNNHQIIVAVDPAPLQLGLQFQLIVRLPYDPLNNQLQKTMALPKNVLGTELKPCCNDPMTGFYRDGYCRTGVGDHGVHTVCAIMTEEFLEFSKNAGNDLSTPAPQYQFPGLKPGDKWCLCASRWQEAYDAGKAPNVVLEATHMSTVEFVNLENLKEFAVKEC